LAITLGFLLIFSEILVDIKQHPAFKGQKPDLERIINLHPDGWKALAVTTTDPNSQGYYDVIVSKIYQHVDGNMVSVVMTWSRDGIRRAGHPQELCYNASGATVTLPRHAFLLTGGKKQNVISFSARQGDIIQDVIYWRVTGGKHDSSLNENYHLTHRFHDVARMLMDDIPDNLMVRVSSWRRDTDPPSTAHIDYIKAYLQSVSPSTRLFLTGVGNY